MESRTMIKRIIIRSVAIILMAMLLIPKGDSKNKTQRLREISPDGNYILLIEEIGKPIFAQIDHIKVTLYEYNNSHEHIIATFHAEISTGEGTAHCQIEWLEDGVQIMLIGSQTHYYILPFKA